MLILKNMIGKVLNKEYAEDEIKYIVESHGKIYDFYCSKQSYFNFKINDIIYLTYRNKNFLSCNKKRNIISATSDLEEAAWGNQKLEIRNFIFDFLFLILLISPLIVVFFLSFYFPLLYQSLSFKALCATLSIPSIFIIPWVLLNSSKDIFLFKNFFEREYKKSEVKKTLSKYTKDNFTMKYRIFNKELSKDNKKDLYDFIKNQINYMPNDKILISEILDKDRIYVSTISRLDILNIAKKMKNKEKIYN